MERLTSKRPWEKVKENLSNQLGYSCIWKRLSMIEDILGDDYDLDRIRNLVEADREGRCIIFPPQPKRSERTKKSVKQKELCGFPMIDEAWEELVKRFKE